MPVPITCQLCGSIVMVKASLAGKKKYCTKKCTDEAFKIRFAGAGNPAYGRTYRTKETHPEWAARIASTQAQSDRMRGNNNPMCQPEVARRMSKTRRERVTSNPEYRQARSERMRQAWADGKYEGVKTGRCKWYDHVKPDGTIVKLQGTWEVVLAQWFDEHQIEYEAHRGRIPYVDHEGVERSYYPDFYVPTSKIHVDVKGAFFDDIQRNKLRYVRSSNPDINLFVINRDAFATMGINVDLRAKSFLNKTPDA